MTRLFEAAKIIDPLATQRSTIGIMLQNPSVRPWKRSIVWAIVSAIHPTWTGSWDDNASVILERYQKFIRLVSTLDIDLDAAPILDVLFHLRPWSR